VSDQRNERRIGQGTFRASALLAVVALAAGLVVTFPAEAVASSSASIGVRILAPADVDIASGAVSVSSLDSLDWTGRPPLEKGHAVAVRVAPGGSRTAESGPAHWLLRDGRNATRTLSIPSEAVVYGAAGEIRVSGLSLTTGPQQASLGGGVAVALGGNIEIGPETPAGAYVGNVLVVTAWE